MEGANNTAEPPPKRVVINNPFSNPPTDLNNPPADPNNPPTNPNNPQADPNNPPTNTNNPPTNPNNQPTDPNNPPTDPNNPPTDPNNTPTDPNNPPTDPNNPPTNPDNPPTDPNKPSANPDNPPTDPNKPPPDPNNAPADANNAPADPTNATATESTPEWGMAAEWEPDRQLNAPPQPEPTPEPQEVLSPWQHIRNQFSHAVNRLTGIGTAAAQPLGGMVQALEPGGPGGAGMGWAGLEEEPKVTELEVRNWLIPRWFNPDQRRQLGQVMDAFPDACPRWIADRMRYHRKSVDEIIFEMTQVPDVYDKFVKNEQGAENMKYLEGLKDKSKFDPYEFLKEIPNPEETYVTKFKSTPNLKKFIYVDLSLTALQNDFYNVRVDYFKKILAQEDYHFYPTYKRIERLSNTTPKHRKRIKPFMKKPRMDKFPWPWPIHPGWVREYQYALHENEIREAKLAVRAARALRLEQAREKGEVSECPVCMQDCTFAETVSCPKAHAFCKDCVNKTLAPKVSIGTTKLPCLMQQCDAFYAPSDLSSVLNKVVYNRLITNVQQEELRQSQDKDERVKECPSCHTLMRVDDPEETLFRCPEPDCQKNSCLQCKLPDHEPLMCNEVEDTEMMMRKYIEEGVAKSLIKPCPTCQRPVIKQEGCDHITCPCRTEFCYKCGGLWRGGPPHADCLLANTNDPLQAGIRAKNEFIQRHPEMKHVAERTDPRQFIAMAEPEPAQKKKKRGKQVPPYQNKRAQRVIAQRATREQRTRLRRMRTGQYVEIMELLHTQGGRIRDYIELVCKRKLPIDSSSSSSETSSDESDNDTPAHKSTA